MCLLCTNVELSADFCRKCLISATVKGFLEPINLPGSSLFYNCSGCRILEWYLTHLSEAVPHLIQFVFGDLKKEAMVHAPSTLW